jgi:hypothetical protein
MLLLITGSSDATADLLIQNCKLSVFRLNFDLWQDYSVNFHPDHWEISNPAGHRITDKTATHCFWWKAFNFLIEADEFVVSEVKYVFRELYGWFLHRGLALGNPPDFHNHFGKLQILDVASRYFRTPDSLAGWNLPANAGLNSTQVVAKSLATGLTNANRVLYTTAVNYPEIDRSFPWFLQTEVDAIDDVTVCICGDEQFAFSRSRKDLQGLDWRREIGEEPDPEQSPWRKRPLSHDETTALRNLCRELRVDWGRFDFLEDKEGLVFLEFNANGQWAFLDFYGENGLLQAVGSYLSVPPGRTVSGSPDV